MLKAFLRNLVKLWLYSGSVFVCIMAALGLTAIAVEWYGASVDVAVVVFVVSALALVAGVMTIGERM